MATRPRVYLDACSYIDVAKGRLGVPIKPGEENRPVDVWYLETLLLAALNEDIEIMASSMILAECLYVEDRNAIPEEAKTIFREILTSGSGVTLIGADFFVCERARDLLWQDGIFCGGAADQIHVATALDSNCEEFITTNKRKGPLQGDRPAKLGKLNMRVIPPSATLVLPPKWLKPLTMDAAPVEAAVTPFLPSTASEPPASQSPGAEPQTSTAPERDRLLDRRDAPGRRPQGSSPDVPPRPPSDE